MVDGDDGVVVLVCVYWIWEGCDLVLLWWIFIYMIEEYGCYVGYVDLLCEGIDG